MRITAAVVRGAKQPFTLETVEIDEPQGHEVLVRIVGVGICHTDVVARDQYLPFPLPAVLGHEGAGIVERVGPSVSKVTPGDHVVLTFAFCGNCEHCRQSRPAYCKDLGLRNFSGIRMAGGSALRTDNGESLHSNFFGQSSFASYALASGNNVVKVPADVPLEILGPLGCGIQTGAGAVLNSLHPPAGSSIAIFGAGPVGLAAVLAAVVAGCTCIIAVDLQQSRRDLARALGATAAIDGGDVDVDQAIRDLTGGEGVAFSLECTGVPSVARQAVDVLRVTGVCGIVGVPPPAAEAAFDLNGLLMGRTVKGIVEGDSVPDVFIPRLIELWREERFPFDRLITFYKLDEINKAVEDATRGGVLKPVLKP